MEQTARRLTRYGNRFFIEHLRELEPEFRDKFPKKIGAVNGSVLASAVDHGTRIRTTSLSRRSFAVSVVSISVVVLVWFVFFLPDNAKTIGVQSEAPIFELFDKPDTSGELQKPLDKTPVGDRAVIGDPSLLNRHAPWGIPDAELIVYRRAYVLGFSPSKKLARWVLYRVEPGENGFGSQKLNDPYISDTLKNEDFKDPFERGSLILPSHVKGHDEEAFKETRYWSVIVPQTKAVRGKLMSHGRKAVEFAENNQTVWVMRGPVYDEPARYVIGDVPVPTRYFYIDILDTGESLRMEAYLYPNEDELEDFDTYRSTVEEIEKAAGLRIIDHQDAPLP